MEVATIQPASHGSDADLEDEAVHGRQGSAPPGRGKNPARSSEKRGGSESAEFWYSSGFPTWRSTANSGCQDPEGFPINCLAGYEAFAFCVLWTRCHLGIEPEVRRRDDAPRSHLGAAEGPGALRILCVTRAVNVYARARVWRGLADCDPGHRKAKEHERTDIEGLGSVGGFERSRGSCGGMWGRIEQRLGGRRDGGRRRQPSPGWNGG